MGGVAENGSPLLFNGYRKGANNDFGATDKESPGTSQQQSLKEELYRTVIMVAGKDPVWSVFPPGITPEEYKNHYTTMVDERYLDKSEMVDLGAIEKIPEGELFGALIWQFNKAMKVRKVSVENGVIGKLDHGK